MLPNGGKWINIGAELLWRSIRATPINQGTHPGKKGWGCNLSNLAELSALQESPELRARIWLAGAGPLIAGVETADKLIRLLIMNSNSSNAAHCRTPPPRGGTTLCLNLTNDAGDFWRNLNLHFQDSDTIMNPLSMIMNCFQEAPLCYLRKKRISSPQSG